MERLPDDCLVIILRYMSYDEISHLRRVNKRLDHLCRQLLNNGFRQIHSLYSTSLRELKQSLPKRESERSKHHLSQRHSLLQAIDTRLSILTMTYKRWIDDGLVCFIPGKVLDELFRLLRIIRDHNSPVINGNSSLSFLQELRDLSSMAMEHFDDHIATELESRLSKHERTSYPSRSRSAYEFLSSTNKAQRFSYNDDSMIFRLRKKTAIQDRLISKLQDKIKVHVKHITSLKSTVHEQNGRITEMAKQIRAIQGFLGLENPISSSPEEGKSDNSGDLVDRDGTAVMAKRNHKFFKAITKRRWNCDEEHCDSKRPRTIDVPGSSNST